MAAVQDGRQDDISWIWSPAVPSTQYTILSFSEFPLPIFVSTFMRKFHAFWPFCTELKKCQKKSTEIWNFHAHPEDNRLGNSTSHQQLTQCQQAFQYKRGE